MIHFSPSQWAGPGFCMNCDITPTAYAASGHETTTGHSTLPIAWIYEVFIMPLWFLPESGHSCGIRRNPAELFLAESPAKIAIPGTIYSGRIEPFRNWDRNGSGMDQNGIWWNAVCISDKSTMHTPSGMFSSYRGVHRALKMTWQCVSWVHGHRIRSHDLAMIFMTFEFQIYLHS